MTLLSYVTDTETGDTLFAIAADDDGADYIWPDDTEPWFDGPERFEMLLRHAETPPTTAADWLSLAGANLGRVSVTAPEELASIDAAVSAADAVFEADAETAGAQDTDLLKAGASAFDSISQDYPGFGEVDDAGEDPQAMLNFVMMMLGPIEPDGPNGWLLRAAEGSPQPGDEDQVIHFPGTPAPEGDVE